MLAKLLVLLLLKIPIDICPELTSTMTVESLAVVCK